MATATESRRKGLTDAQSNDRSEHWLVAGHYDPAFVQFIESELGRLAGLPGNWDKYGAPEISRDIIATALKFAKGLPENIVYRPRVVPMSTGNLQFEWHQGPKILELEFESPQQIRYLQWHPEKDVEEEDTFRADDMERAVDLIQWFMSGTCV